MRLTPGQIDWDAQGCCGSVADRNVDVEAMECVASLGFNIECVELVTCT